MGKRALVKYLSELKKKELEEQLLDLYGRFSQVKEYYDFVFSPKEEKLVHEAKTRISNEYFPLKGKRPKARRSIAQKWIKHFIQLGVDPYLTAEVMLHNVETAQSYSVHKNVPEAFYKSMGNSFNELVHYISLNGFLSDYKDRIVGCYLFATEHKWPNQEAFSKTLDSLD